MSILKHIRVVTFCLACCFPAFAQGDKARLTGTVVDTTGAVIPGATVTVTTAKTGEIRRATANEQGLYVIPSLAPATYRVAGEAPGLGPNEYTDIALAAGQERTLNIVLQPATVAHEITVSGGELTVIDTSSARVGANVNEREVANMPLNGRQLSQLYLLAPGAQTAGGGSYDNIRFSGRANQQNAIRFDGVEASAIIDSSPGNLNGESSSPFRLQSSLENVQEFRIESSNYPAEYGTGTAGQISIATKSGSNDFHGSLFEYLRNDALDARNFFDGSSKSPLRLNQFGGSAGGPIRREKAFFFAAYEGLRQRAGVNLIATVPSAAARARAVPAIQPLLAAYPVGTTPSANPDLDFARLNAANTVDENYGSLRLDYRFNDKYTMYARYFRDQGEAVQPLDVSGSRFLIQAVPQNALLSFQQVLAPTVINETKFGFNGYKTRASGFAPPVNGVDLSAISVDISGNTSIPGIGGQGASAGTARIGGLVRSNSTQNGRGQPYTNYTLSFIDNLSWISGGHSLKFGVEIRPIRMYTDRLGGTTYAFSNLNDFLNNRPSNVQFLGDVSAPSPFNNGATGNRLAKQEYYIGYAQDEWKIRPNLTMNYGLRYEYYSVLREDRNLAVLFDADSGRLLPSGTLFYQSSKLNFGPRLAFSWSPERLNGKTVLRIGAGYYYGPGQTEDLIQPIESDRVSRTLTGLQYPIIPADIIAGYNVNDPNLGFQPRAYSVNGYRVPERVLSYTASVQQELPSNTVLTVAYVGSQGRNLFLRSWTNRIVGVEMNPTTGAARDIRQFGGRFAQIDYKTSGGTDNYNSLQTTLNRRFSHGLTFGSQWTWAHSIGNTGGSNEAQTATNPFNFRADRGNNAFDVRHSVNLSALYELPFRGLFSAWQVGGIWNYRTGLPVDLKITRPDIVYRDTRTGAYVNSPIVVGGVPVTTPVINVPGGGAFRNVRRPDVIAGVDPFLRASDKRMMLNPAAFAIPQPGTFGNLGRYALHGPSLSQFDVTLQKRFPIHEQIAIEFRSEIYNIFNHTNFANPPATLNNALGTGSNQLQPGQPFTAAAAGGAF
ncbi:MAG TPA: TonB-dependent receptor, partial [Bryobacteraceae bacterium]|nr:TonB-dependent receptor [Bryobacteraceae bacterium]